MLRIVEYMLQTWDGLLRGINKPEIVMAVEVEITVNEAIKIVALLKPNSFGRIAYPAVKLGSYTDNATIFL